MKDEALPRQLRAVVGEGVRRVREGAGLRQDDVAAAARRHGLLWNRGRIATLEQGRKAISAEELALLPSVLTEACGRSVGLDELIAPDAYVRLTPTVAIDGQTLAATLGGQPPRHPFTAVVVEEPSPDIGSEYVPGVVVLGGPEPRIEVGPFVPLESELESWLQEAGEAEANAARRLGRPVAEVVVAARALWGRSLSRNRDLMVNALYGDDASPDRRRALRGQVTRQLTKDLDGFIGQCEARSPRQGSAGGN